MNKSAREMFEELGFKFEHKKEYVELTFGKEITIHKVDIDEIKDYR